MSAEFQMSKDLTAVFPASDPAREPAGDRAHEWRSSNASPENASADAASDVSLPTRCVATGWRSPACSRRSGWQLVNVRELWQFRELLFFLTWRDVKVRYKQTALGAAWAVLQPVDDDGGLHLFFGRLAGVARGACRTPLFAYLGLLPWTFFATAVTARATASSAPND